MGRRRSVCTNLRALRLEGFVKTIANAALILGLSAENVLSANAM